jgi:ubiquinone/menaquinone biosynthesis C-methylase UbiE
MTSQTRTRPALRLTVRVLAGAAVALVLVVVLLAVTLGGPNDREADLLVEALGITPGMTVAEVGAGDGWLTVEMARRVGPAGRVYSTEIEDWQLEEIRAAARDAGVSNVTVLQAGERSTNLPPACCDAIFMRRVYHHLSAPGSVTSDLHRALKPSGRLAVIEFGAGSVIGAVTREGIDSADLARQVTDSGLEAVTVGDWPGLGHYVAVFRKPAP